MLVPVASSGISLLRTLRTAVIHLLALTVAITAVAAVTAVVHIGVMEMRHRHTPHHVVFCVPMHERAAATANSASIVDVAPNVTDVLSLLTLAPGEHVVAVDDETITGVESWKKIQLRPHAPGSYMDITTNQRRILVLQH